MIVIAPRRGIGLAALGMAGAGAAEGGAQRIAHMHHGAERDIDQRIALGLVVLDAGAAGLRAPGAAAFCGLVGMAVPRPMPIQNSASAGAAMMMANSVAVTACGGAAGDHGGQIGEARADKPAQPRGQRPGRRAWR